MSDPFRRPDLGGQLGNLLRSTLGQLDSAREVVTRATREGRTQLDLALLRRRRKDALVRLGEATARLVQRGDLDPDEHPELDPLLARLADLDGEEQRLAGFTTDAPSGGRRSGGHGSEPVAEDLLRARAARARAAATDDDDDDDDDDGDDGDDAAATDDDAAATDDDAAATDDDEFDRLDDEDDTPPRAP